MWKELKPFLLIVLGGFIIWMALHVLGVIGTAATAPGRVINKTLSTDNIITSYEWFHDSNAQFKSRVAQISSHKYLIKEETNPQEKSRLNIDLSAMKQSCRDLAVRYNANSQKMNKSIFKGDSLPETLNIQLCE
jgi:hypothetical protein